VAKVTYAILNDIHFPFESKAYYKALEIMRNMTNLSSIYLNGDVAEINSVSSHPKTPQAKNSLLEELEYVNKKLDQLQNMFVDVPVHYICGNHEHRIYRYVRDVAPEMFGMLDCPKLLKFENRPGWKFYEYTPTQLVKVGKTKDLYCRHEPLAGGANHAAGTAAKSLVSIIYGHTHVYQLSTHKKFGPKPTLVTAMSNGYLGNINDPCFDYRGSRDNWVNGFCIVECDEYRMTKPDTTPKYSPVFVIWDDAFSIDEWVPTDTLDIQKSNMVHTIGFLIKKTDSHTIVALNHDVENDMVSCVIYIPNAMVKAFVPLDK
jgi:predicted phosphodiesterase